MSTFTTKPVVSYYLNEEDLKKLERDARRWKRAALRLARAADMWGWRSPEIAKETENIRKMNGGKL